MIVAIAREDRTREQGQDGELLPKCGGACLTPAGPPRFVGADCHHCRVAGGSPANSQVAHLHVHSEHSVLDGACNIGQMAARAADLGMPALGLTDHGVMNGAVDMYSACREQGIKPILGIEAYFVDDRNLL
ncbi:MAG: PHP domain-containing protein, partial [Solirubrobacterales bacterium]